MPRWRWPCVGHVELDLNTIRAGLASAVTSARFHDLEAARRQVLNSDALSRPNHVVATNRPVADLAPGLLTELG